MVKNLSAMQETWIRSLGWEDPLEKGMATHSSILAWRIGINTWKRGWKREWAERVKPRCGPSDSCKLITWEAL